MTKPTFFQANFLSHTTLFSFFTNAQNAGRCLLFTLILGCATSLLHAQTTWNGSVSADWNDPANWSAGIPDATDDVTIPNVAVAPIILDITAALAKSVEVQSGGSLTVNALGSLTINGAIVQGFLNRGTVANNGIITIGNLASVGSIGLVNETSTAIFQNNAGSEISIDRATLTGLLNDSGTFTNAGKITIGAVADVGQDGILNAFNSAVFQNNVGGEISIDRTTVAGLHNKRSFTNAGKIIIGAVASVGSFCLMNEELLGVFQNEAGGDIQIDHTTGNGLQNSTFSTFTNKALITIGANGLIGSSAIKNTGTFLNDTCAALINIVSNNIINNSGTFTNSGGIIENASGNSSISTNTGVVQNLNGGNFSIGSGNAATTAAGDIWTGCSSTDWADPTNWLDGSVPTVMDVVTIPNVANDPIVLAGTAAVARSVKVETDGSLTVSATGSLDISNAEESGMLNIGTVENNGTIRIDATGTEGVFNLGTFTNKARLIIGAVVSSIGTDGIKNTGTFLNDICAETILFDNLNNSATFTNAGLFSVNTGQVHTNTALTNDGIIGQILANPIPNVTNNDFIVAHQIIGCAGGTNMLQKGNALSFTATANWFTDPNLTNPAGTYNQAANTFTPNGLPAGQQLLFFSISDDVNGCPRTVSILVDNNADATPPTITCPGPVSVSCAGQVPAVNLASVIANDNCGTPTKSHVGDVISNMTCANRKTITRTYSATGGSGNSTTCAQVITVFDNTKPNFTSVPANVTVQCSSVPAVGSPIATDGCGDGVNITYNGQSTTNGTCPDSYILTRQWTATDACGNTKTVSQRVTVIDTQKPNFVSIPANITVQCDNPIIQTPATPTATDNCDASVAIAYNGQTQTGGTCANAYTLTRTWTAVDNCGNTRSISQRITVVDNGKPVFTSFPGNTSITCDETPPAIGSPTASDACGPATVAYLGQSTTNGSCPGNYQIKRTWRATDACGNSTAATQTIQVTDTGVPVFTSVPGPLTIECTQAIPPLVNPTATDACGGYVHITFLGNVATGSGCTADYTITRTWQASDLCGNTTSAVQVITVEAQNFNAPGIQHFIIENQPDNTRFQHLNTEFRASETELQPSNFEFQMFPNPAQEAVLVSFFQESGGEASLILFDASGRLTQRQAFYGAEGENRFWLELAGVPDGTYTVQVLAGGQRAVGKLVVIKN